MKLSNEEGKEVGGGGGEFGKELRAELKLEIPPDKGDEAAAVDVEKQQHPVAAAVMGVAEKGKVKEREREKEKEMKDSAMSNGGIPSPESLEAQ